MKEGNKMPKVLLEMPIAFVVQKYLLEWANETKTPLSLIDTETKTEIYERFVNTSEIGLTMRETPASGRRLGFVTPTTVVMETEKVDLDDQDRPTFKCEAVLVLQEGETWILEVENADNLEVYQGVAEALKNKFNVNIQMSATYMDNPEVAE